MNSILLSDGRKTAATRQYQLYVIQHLRNAVEVTEVLTTVSVKVEVYCCVMP